jgi:hypothetical protein
MRRTLITRNTAEGRFPYKLDVHVPEANVRRRLKDMLDWCRKNTTAQWTHHVVVNRERRDVLGVPLDFVRFYFMEESDAEAFRRAWPTEQSAPSP